MGQPLAVSRPVSTPVPGSLPLSRLPPEVMHGTLGESGPVQSGAGECRSQSSAERCSAWTERDDRDVIGYLACHHAEPSGNFTVSIAPPQD